MRSSFMLNLLVTQVNSTCGGYNVGGGDTFRWGWGLGWGARGELGRALGVELCLERGGVELGRGAELRRGGLARRISALLEVKRSPDQKSLFPGDAASTAAPGCAALAGLRNPCKLWRSSLLRKPPDKAFFARACAAYMRGSRLMRGSGRRLS